MTKKTAGNMTLWDNMREVDRNFTKPITGKSYKGDSPNPTYVIRKITEQLGPIGFHWGFRVMSEQITYGQPHQVITKQRIEYDSTGKTPLSKDVEYDIIREEHHQITLRFWFRDADDRIGEFDANGGTPMLYMTKNGRWMHDEDAPKKSLTDAYTKGASWLGACADIFLGLFDDKYSGGNTPAEQKPSSNNSKAPEPTGQRENSVTDDAWN